MRGSHVLDSRSFTAVQLVMVTAALMGAAQAIARLATGGPLGLEAIWQIGLAAAAVTGAAIQARSYGVLRRELVARVRGEEAARAEALTDELTGAFNRRGFRALGEHQLRVARRNGSDVLVLCADVNAFKSINDRFGHAQGDAALRDVAAILRRTVRDTDVVARLGGDEFAVLVVDAGADAERAVLGRLAEALAAYNGRPERCHTLSLSIGAARLGANPGAELDELVSAADDALYRAKPAGRSRARPTPLGVTSLTLDERLRVFAA